MTARDISTAKNPDQRNAMVAMRRAAAMARATAIATGTAIIIMRDGRPIRITADELRRGEG